MSSVDPTPKRRLTWNLYLAEVLPELLDEAGVAPKQTLLVVAEVAVRAQDYAAGGRASRRALRVAFLDDVADFEPADAPIGTRADVAVVVRNSALEEDHARGLVDDKSLLEMTYLACGALNEWLAENANTDEDALPVGVFAAVADYPRAYVALQALALAAERGGRKAFKTPARPLPSLPTAVSSDAVRTDSGHIRRSATSAADSELVDVLSCVVAGEVQLLVTSSLSRYSRNSVMLSHVLEVALGHGATVLTTNLMLRPGEAFARRPPFAAANSREPFASAGTERLSGVHAKQLRAALHQVFGRTDIAH